MLVLPATASWASWVAKSHQRIDQGKVQQAERAYQDGLDAVKREQFSDGIRFFSDGIAAIEDSGIQTAQDVPEETIELVLNLHRNHIVTHSLAGSTLCQRALSVLGRGEWKPAAFDEARPIFQEALPYLKRSIALVRELATTHPDIKQFLDQHTRFDASAHLKADGEVPFSDHYLASAYRSLGMSAIILKDETLKTEALQELRQLGREDLVQQVEQFHTGLATKLL